jgi:hypothetical protein
LPEAARSAIERCANRMLDEADDARGIAGIRRLAREIPSWASREDAPWVASFNSRCIEKFGNGGGNFRRLYAGFLEWARVLDPALVPAEAPALATRAADGWTGVAEALGEASQEMSRAESWRIAAERAAAVADIEHELFSRLADR